MVGKAVQNAAGERIGTVKDLLFDDKGTMSAVVIGFGGFLGIGEKSVGLPFEMVKASRDASGNMILTASLDREAINAAPDFMSLEDIKARSAPSTPTTPTTPSGTPSSPARP
jgi:sporulation protein YlmC with PRC-barrel domain